ncbi:MAG: hypothetical protein M3R07_12615 [Gemmatimonadota bacterium]|nr:hypothetical protein [Gemmatimonadota bacterium]
MFIELIDLLRCPREHEDSWLVAAFTKMDGRFVIEGKLGCPVCSASYPVVDGVARFAPARGYSGVTIAADETEPLRIAAMLNLTRPGSVVVLEGSSAIYASAIVGLTEARVLALNAAGTTVTEAERVAEVIAGNRIPVAARSVDGIVIESGTQETIEDALRVLVPGGRIVAPADADLGNMFREIARDDRNVVGETIGQLVSLGRVAGR